MKKTFTLLAASIISILLMLSVCFAEGEGYGAVADPTDGKEYVLVWNKNINNNLGDNYALTAEENGVMPSTVTIDDLAAGNVDSKSVWILEAISDGVWAIRNSETGAYLRYDASAADSDKITVASERLDDDTTSWKLEMGSVTNQFKPVTDNGVKLRYSVGNNDFMVRSDSNNSWVWIYEKGVEMCTDHTYSSCLSTVCDNCGLATRDANGLAHTYSSDDDTDCDICGYVRFLFDEMDVNENTAVRTFTATFYDNGYDSIANDDYKNQFNLTPLVASIAPLEDVTHVDIKVEASNVERFDNPNNAAPTCQLFWNGWWNQNVANKKFSSDGIVEFSADVDPEFVQSIWLLPYAFTPETEISFRISVEVTYGGSDSAADYGEPLTSIVSFSDYQLWGSDSASNNGEALKGQVVDIFNTMKKVNPDLFIFGGDYGCGFATDSSNYARTQALELISNMWSNIGPDKGNYVQVEGNHDTAEVDGFVPTGGYEYDDVIVYVLNEDDMPWSMYSESDKAVCEATAKKMTEYFDSLIKAGETRPVIIASHTCLHYDAARNDGNNQYAYIVFDAINEAAKKLDIIFMFGHNHSTGDPEIGGGLAFKAVGDTIYVSDEDCYDSTGKGYQDRLNIGRAEKLNFTYMTYGYVGYIGGRLNDNEVYSGLNPSTALTVSEMNIYDDKITVTVYSAGGRMSSYSQVINRINKAGDVLDTDTPDETAPSETTEITKPDSESGSSSVAVYIVIAVVAVAVAAVVVVLATKKKAKK